MRCFVTVTHYLGCRAELGRHVAMDTYLDCLPTLISNRSFCSLLQTIFFLWMRALALTRKPPSREPYISSHSCYTERKAWHTVPNPSGRLVVHPKQISPCVWESNENIGTNLRTQHARKRQKSSSFISACPHWLLSTNLLIPLLLPDGISLTGTDGKNHSWRHWVLSWVIIFEVCICLLPYTLTDFFLTTYFYIK